MLKIGLSRVLDPFASDSFFPPVLPSRTHTNIHTLFLSPYLAGVSFRWVRNNMVSVISIYIYTHLFQKNILSTTMCMALRKEVVAYCCDCNCDMQANQIECETASLQQMQHFFACFGQCVPHDTVSLVVIVVHCCCYCFCSCSLLSL